MQIQKRYWVGLMVLGFLGVIVFVLLPSPEPIVNGHTVSYWLDKTTVEGSELSSKSYEAALAAMDDRCILALTHELKLGHPSILSKIGGLTQRWLHFRFPFRDPRDRPRRAAVILGRLGSRATNAVPALEYLIRYHKGDANETDSAVKGSAIAALILIRHEPVDACARKAVDGTNLASKDYLYAIFFLRTNAAPGVPIFAEAVQKGTNEEVRHYAARMLGWIHSQPDVSLPALHTMLNETNALSRIDAISSISAFGEEAKPAWNDLFVLLDDPDDRVRRFTTNGLVAIDSVAAQKIGIKSSP